VTGVTVSFATLGCRLNQVDTQEIQALLEARGFRTVPFEQPADVVVVNSCTVTGRAEFSDRQMIHRAGRRNPGARVVVTGCWAQTSAGAVAAVPGVDLVVGNGDKHRLPDLVEGLLAGKPIGRIHVSDIGEAREVPVAPLAHLRGRSRAFLKVQEGCRHRCAFCIVPVARGHSRSVAADVVVERVQRLVDAGHPEVVLTGIDLGHYGADLVPRTTLGALVRALVDVRGLRWLRLSSVLPAYFTPALLEVVAAAPQVAPHFHVPLQSGSDRVLRRMRRPYNVALYRRVIERLVAARPRLGLGTDLIVGFPGETDADFAETVALVKDLPFTYLHVFPYSDREGTEATRLDGRVDGRTIGRRAERLRGLGRAAGRAFRERLLGETHEALVLETRDRRSGALTGLTGHYVEVTFDGPDALMGRLVPVRVVAAGDERAAGELVGAGEGRHVA
jgi:threonylcarbamoyladenosine tRNA methylthiotransferase MtaB